jgi:hypothetical protein
VIESLILQYIKGFIMNGIIARIVSAFFTKEKIIGYVGGIIISLAAAGLDMQPKVIKDAVCLAYPVEEVK